jgi:hypothetical protein
MRSTTFGTNTEKLKGLWPTALFPGDWLELFRNTFEGRNQFWVSEALNRVKLRYSSSQPELRWIAEAFREIEREQSAATRAKTETDNPRKTREDDLAEVEADHRMMLEELLKLDPFTRWEALDRISNGPLGFLVGKLGHDPKTWGRFAVGMVWASIQLERPGVREQVLASMRGENRRTYA